MCGIAGFIGIAGSGADRLPETVDRMLQAIGHRGPDESRIVQAGHAVLGTARLALVDRPTSQQPISDTSGRYLLAFNGEIYNYRELRQDLQRVGVSFRTAGDTEVLLQTLIRWGSDGLSRLKGQFALGLWDSVERQLLLARDRFGIVPLFWRADQSGGLFFASEVKALQAAGLSVSLSVPDLIDAGVLWGLHPGRSAFSAVDSVAPGSFVRWHDGSATVGRYWSFGYAESRPRGQLADQAQELSGLLQQAIARRVPETGDAAVLLSGGLDSSAVLAVLREIQPDQRIDSYSIEFARTVLDEAPYQALASQAFNTHHQSVVCDDSTTADALVDAVLHAEQPLVRTAPASSILLAEVIEQHGTRVVLSGEGADELFCGYDVFKVAAIRDAWSRDTAGGGWSRLLEQALRQQHELGRAVERAFYEQGLDTRSDPLFSHLNRWKASFRITQYLAPELRAGLTEEFVLDQVRERLPDAYHAWSAVEQAQYLEATYFLSSALLGSQCDRPYMAHSIEARYPFLDEDLIDFALSLPEASKLQALQEKVVLKKAVQGRVPAPICERVKQPYTAPEGDAFRSGPGRELLEQYLSTAALKTAGLFDEHRVDWLVNKLHRKKTSFHDDLALLWILSTQVLADIYGVAEQSRTSIEGRPHG